MVILFNFIDHLTGAKSATFMVAKVALKRSGIAKPSKMRKKVAKVKEVIAMGSTLIMAIILIREVTYVEESVGERKKVVK